MSLCLAAAGLMVQLGTTEITLRWTHSVQKTVWEEDWRQTPEGLQLAAARVMGSGAGMDPPPDARRDGDFWAWVPHVGPIPSLTLRRSGATDDWQICRHGQCTLLSHLLPKEADPVRLEPCPS